MNNHTALSEYSLPNDFSTVKKAIEMTENIDLNTQQSLTPANQKAIVNVCFDLVAMNNFCLETDKQGFIKELSRYSHKMGLPMEQLLNVLYDSYGIERDVAKGSVTNIYQNEKNSLGTLSFFAKLHLCKDYQPDAKNSPKVPDDVYDNLPKLLSRCFYPLKEHRQMDMFLFSSLAVLGGCLKDYSGVYDGKTVFPTLYNFIIAPPASGKGVMEHAKQLGYAYHEEIVMASKDAMREYLDEIDQYNGDGDEEKPIKPTQKILFVPGNSSSAAMVERLTDSDGRLILFETEADSIARSGGVHWTAGFSEILRCAFHHETIATNRKGMDGIIEIKRPKLSIALSGTQSQVISLIKSPENGLFSRFMYYAFSEPLTFRDVSPNNTPIANKDLFFEELSDEFLKMIHRYDNKAISFSLTSKQWERIVEKYRIITDYYSLNSNNTADIGSIITRNGIINFRIAMILSAIRNFENDNSDTQHICIDTDFETANKLADVLLVHSMIVLKMLPKAQEQTANLSLNNFFNMLPQTFTRSEAIDIGKNLNLSQRSCDGYLKQLCKKEWLRKPTIGRYEKK